MNLNHVRCIILVTKPRVERFFVTSSGGDLTSSLDQRLQVHVLPNSFKGSKELAFEVGFFSFLSWILSVTVDYVVYFSDQ
jgi:hypothetical protein